MNKIYLLSPWVAEKYLAPQNSLEYIKYFLIDSGYRADIIDCAKYDEDLNAVISILKEDRRPIIGITAYTRERFHAYDLIKKIRREIPDSVIVVGGRHFGSLAEETLHELPEIDIVVRGEGEITFKEICDNVCNSTGYAEILGISYSDGSKIIHNPDRPFEMNLDKFRSYDVNDIQNYAYLSHAKMDNKNRFFTIFATRGCPSSCVFCSLKDKKVRLRSIDNIVEEIETKVNATGVRYIKFGDSSLTLKEDFIIDLCERLIKEKLNIRWNCYSRVNIDLNLLKLMKEAGLVSTEIGLESGSPKVLKSIKKRINLDQVEKFCKEAYNLGIKTYIFCLISLPDERLEDVDMTLNFVKKISSYIYRAGIQTTRILPDAALSNIAVEKKVFPKDFSWIKQYKVPDEYLDVSNPLYRTLPIYLEHLTVKDIKVKISEFNTICNKDLVYFDTLRNVFRRNLKKEVLRSITFNDFKRKSMRAFNMVIKAYRNRKKEAYFD